MDRLPGRHARAAVEFALSDRAVARENPGAAPNCGGAVRC